MAIISKSGFFSKNTNVIGYIAKMQRIYLICAIVVYRDTAYLCKEHGLRETRLEQVGYVIV